MEDQAVEFENLVGNILEINNFIISPSLPETNNKFDFHATLGNEKWAIEVKFYRTPRAQAGLIENAAIRLNHEGVKARVTKGMLVVSCYLPAELRLYLETSFNLTFIDRADLINWSAKNTEILGKLQSILGIPSNDLTQDGDTTSEPKLNETPLNQAPPQEDSKGTELCQELKKLNRGKKHWPDYEKLCVRILKYLFPNDLYGWHDQKRTDDGLNRYDSVCRIQSTTEFWQFIVQHLDSRYVIFEFKNYTGKIKQGQILTTEKYLLEKALRRVAIIFSRDGADKNAVTMTQGAMRESGKLMLILDDDKVCEMLHMKERGEDPTDYLFDLADNFLLTLPR
ncbi:hypothetical protein [Gluconobacter cerinus]|uniref:Restriction endonuclease type IV Mrr domain-containing protein n=1 Tax=Gluconobacter cerinus TaxID=38307 RepID=A0AAV5NII8_9PROT|nr:hypothetical protein [Gluconobacter cerinus]GBQ94878.1 hypothetical protein AA0229_0077 [Gluconobacter cerinus NRIC 0229]GLQ64101.1 hypothetical protein GCM10007867_29470 [Gluconobacter cerinus]